MTPKPAFRLANPERQLSPAAEISGRQLPVKASENERDLSKPRAGAVSVSGVHFDPARVAF
jgi:hypothetical protein